MTFEEIRRLLNTHFSRLLAERKLQIATGGRLTQIQTSAYENGMAFALGACLGNGLGSSE
jgi:hypothetical protein